MIDLSQFTGTENYYRHPIQLGPKCVYTDGVAYFATHAKAYWFLDIVFTELNQLQRDHEFLAITLSVQASKATITATDGNDPDKTLWSHKVEFTDCPDGNYLFFFTNDVFFLRSEY